MMKQVPKKNVQQQNNSQFQQHTQNKTKDGLKQFKNPLQQKQQVLIKQQALKYFNKSTFFNIALFLKAKEIMDLRMVCRHFNKVFIDCAPAFLNYFEGKDEVKVKKEIVNPKNLVFPKLKNVDISQLKLNLENRGMYACVEKLHQDNLFSVDLIFDIITLDLPPWRKAKFTFPLKVKTILEKYDFNLFNLNDQQLQFVLQRKNYDLARIILYNDDFDQLLSFTKNLIQVAAFQDYKYFCDWYDVEQENQQQQRLIVILREKSQQYK